MFVIQVVEEVANELSARQLGGFLQLDRDYLSGMILRPKREDGVWKVVAYFKDLENLFNLPFPLKRVYLSDFVRRALPLERN